MAKEANVIMYYVDAEEEPQRVAGFNVAGLPTLIKIEDGEEVGRVVGANKTAFAKMLKA
jgi:thioredoxin-like negative regulator of GroEL